MQLKPKKQNNRQEIAFLKDMIYQLADQVDALNTALVCMSIIHGTDPASWTKLQLSNTKSMSKMLSTLSLEKAWTTPLN